MKKSYFEITDRIKPIQGLTNSEYWNGFPVVYLDRESINQINEQIGCFIWEDWNLYEVDEEGKYKVESTQIGGKNYYILNWSWEEIEIPSETYPYIEQLIEECNGVEFDINEGRDRDNTQIYTLNIINNGVICDEIIFYNLDECEEAKNNLEYLVN